MNSIQFDQDPQSIQQRNCPSWSTCDRLTCQRERICLNGEHWAKYWKERGRRAMGGLPVENAPEPKRAPPSDVCYYCEKPFGYGDREKTRDHIIPVSKGGVSRQSNYVQSCKRCNMEKDNMLPEEFAVYLGYLLEGHQRPDRTKLLTMLYNTRKLIQQIASFRMELIKTQH
jgi:5-methylcytosine-specific restriction endonuclease McrA